MSVPHDEQDHYPDLIAVDIQSACVLKAGTASRGFRAECNVFVFVVL